MPAPSGIFPAMSGNSIIFWISSGILFTGLYAVIAETGKARRIGAAVTVLAALGVAYSVQGLIAEWSRGEKSGATAKVGVNNGVVTQNQSGGTNIGQQNNIAAARLVALSRDCRQAEIPISVPPHTSDIPIYVVNIHPKILDNPSGWVPEVLQNGTDKPWSWPPPSLAILPKHVACCDFSTYRCDFENLGEVPFLSVRVEFLVMYPKQTLVDPHHKTFVITSTLDPRQKFSVYLNNASHEALYCWYPVFADVQLIGDSKFRNIPIQSSNATILTELQWATLFPTRWKWNGLP
jgi:hypothetical protein